VNERMGESLRCSAVADVHLQKKSSLVTVQHKDSYGLAAAVAQLTNAHQTGHCNKNCVLLKRCAMVSKTDFDWTFAVHS